MTWDEHYNRWRDARTARRNAQAFDHLQSARKRVAGNTAEDWEWLKTALSDREKKWFVAAVFLRQPVPWRLFDAFMQAAVVDVDASSNRWLLEPCLETFGRGPVVEALQRFKEKGVVPKERIESALYWCLMEPRKSRGNRPGKNV